MSSPSKVPISVCVVLWQLHSQCCFALQDLVYKGVVKVTYDRGYALQTKSLLVENVTTASEAVEQLFDALGLRGNPSDYAMEEQNLMTGGT